MTRIRNGFVKQLKLHWGESRPHPRCRSLFCPMSGRSRDRLRAVKRASRRLVTMDLLAACFVSKHIEPFALGLCIDSPKVR